MKWAVIVMTALGVVAAICAAILVAVVFHPRGAPRNAGPPPQVAVLIAAKNLPAMAVVQAADVRAKMMVASQAPGHYLSNSVQVVGRVLAVAMVKGEAFSSKVFASQGVGANLAAAIPFSRRAVGVAITNYAALQGMLYPGCAVDVLLTLTPPAAGSRAGAALPIATTVLQNVEVLAIDNSTVDSPPAVKAGSGGNSGAGGSQRVSLLVSPRQAEILRLAANAGSLSLALRNPLDTKLAHTPTLTLKAVTPDHYLRNLYRPKTSLAMLAAALPPPPAVAAAAVTPKPATPPQWKMQVIRGPQSQVESFPLSEVRP